MNVSKYALIKDLIILDKLFFSGDEIYIQSYDPVNGRPQNVYLPDKTLIGSITSSFFWDLKKKLIKLD